MGMQISLVQRVVLFIINIVVKTIWFFDWLKEAPQKVLFGLAKVVFILYLGIVLATGIYTNLSSPRTTTFSNQLASGIVANLYSDNSFRANLSPGVLGASSSTVPALVRKIAVPTISAKSVLVIDESTHKVLFSLNSSAKAAPASTTKLMTALVALDLYSQDDKLSVPLFCTQIESQKAGFPENEIFTVRDLLYSLLVSSAGDAACTLAAGKIPPTEFISQMNLRAQELGMTNTSFVNPIGLDGIANSHYSTAEDLYKLSQAAITNKTIRQIVATRDFHVTSVDKKFSVELSNTNKLLWELPNSVGIKTGTTEEAGEVLIYEYKDDLKDLIIIVMGSQDRFYDTQAILRWILQSYSW